MVVMFIFSAAMLVGSLVWVIMDYVWFTSPECGLNIFLVTQVLVTAAALTILSLTPFVEHGSLLTSAVMSTYLVYQTWAAMVSEPDPECNSQWYSSTDTTTATIVCGSVFVVVTLLYLSFRERAAPDPSASETEEHNIKSIANNLLTEPKSEYESVADH
jgi:hypothetical protein